MDAGNEDNEPAPDESDGKRELSGYMRSAHSPFGSLWSIATATGWSLHYMLWRLPWAALQAMVADAPRYVHGSPVKRGGEIESEDDLKEFLNLQ